uniref:Uncharacterized protein n=1 Tax=Lotharella oceanica TaxID=641309 RepID=A0A7S2TGF8_9EUKA
MAGRWYLTGYSGGISRAFQSCQVVERSVGYHHAINERVTGRFGPFPFSFNRRYEAQNARGVYRRFADYPLLGIVKVTTVVLDVVRDWWNGYQAVIEYACLVALGGFRFQEVRVLTRDREISPSTLDLVDSILRQSGLEVRVTPLDHMRCPRTDRGPGWE